MDPHVQGVETVLEALVSVSVVKGQLQRLKSTLLSIQNTGQPTAPLSTRTRATTTTEAGGVKGTQIVAHVFPLNTADKYGPQGSWKGELWLTPNEPATQGSCITVPTPTKATTVESKRSTESPLSSSSTPSPTAAAATTTTTSSTCCVVLGAGNQGFLTIVDCLDALFIQNEVVLLKHHPLRGYQDPFIRAIFAPLIDLDYFNAVPDTTIADAAALVAHPRVGHVHMTGGKATHDAILWGSTLEERTDRKQRNAPKLQATLTSELGCVTPWIVVPETFTEKELLYQASHLAAVLNANSSCNCNSPKVILMSSHWPQRERFVREVKNALQEMPITPPYYPGETDRYNRFTQAYPVLGRALAPKDTVVPRVRATAKNQDHTVVAIPDLPFLAIDLSIAADGTCPNNYALRNEAFSPVVTFVTVTALHDANPPTFMAAASTICNERIFGTLSCTVILHPNTEKKYPKESESLVANLKYGTVCINAWTALCYAIDTCCWGAFPGEDPREAESGTGFVRNTLLFDHVQKSVVRAPLVDSKGLTHVQKWPLNKKENVLPVLGFVIKPSVASFCAILFPKWCCSTMFCGSLVLVLAASVAIGGSFVYFGEQ
jgi:hypothetical protein